MAPAAPLIVFADVNDINAFTAQWSWATLPSMIHASERSEAVGTCNVVGVGGAPVNYSVMLPRLPVLGSTVNIRAFLRNAGGPVATSLVALSRLGVRTAFCGITGGDDEGRFFREALTGSGVNIEGVEADPTAQNRIVIVLVDTHTGERSFRLSFRFGGSAAARGPVAS